MSRKKHVPLDPRIAAARERIDKATVSFERWYGRMKRAVTAMDKARKAIAAAPTSMSPARRTASENARSVG